jgi:hypothetical protein
MHAIPRHIPEPIQPTFAVGVCCIPESAFGHICCVPVDLGLWPLTPVYGFLVYAGRSVSVLAGIPFKRLITISRRYNYYGINNSISIENKETYRIALMLGFHSDEGHW